MVLRKFFFILCNTNEQLVKWELSWSNYTFLVAFSTTEYVEIINKKKFTEKIFEENKKTFIMHPLSIMKLTIILIDLFSLAQVVLIIIKKIKILAKPYNFVDIICFDFLIQTSEYIGINNYQIN